MRSSIIMFALLCGMIAGPFTNHLQSQTIFNNKQFTQDTTLTVNGSPYEVVSDLTVSGGATLTLEAGVKLIFEPQVNFFLDGKLKVKGTQGDSVRFEVKPDSIRRIWNWPRWEGISSPPNATQAPVIEAAYMHVRHASLFLDQFDSVSVRHSAFWYNDANAEAGSFMEFEHCYFHWYATSIIGTARVSYSTFNNGGTGISSVKSNIQHCTFMLNESGAVWDRNGTVINHSSFVNNNYALIISTSFSWPQGFRDSTFVLHNEFRDNINAIEVEDDSFSANIHGVFRHNLVCGTTVMSLLLVDSTSIDFSQNCWCSLDTAEVLSYMNRLTNSGLQPITDPGFLLPFETDCVPDLVYPGDANHDQLVNVLDILTIGQYFGQTGPPRPNASLAWQGQEAPDWDSLQTTGYDLKHADCNGDSTIDWADTTAVRLHYGNTHRSRRTASVNGIPLILQAPANAQNPGDTVRLPIALGTVDTIASNVYGIAFSIHYDSSQVVPYPSVAFFNSWLGNPGNDLITFWYLDSVNHRVDVALVRTNGLARTGFGHIAELVVVIDDDITKREVPLRLSFSGVHAIDSAGNTIPISSYVERTVVEVEYFGNLFRTYPNPAPHYFSVEPKTSAPYDVILIDMTGKQWLDRRNVIGMHRIPMSDKPGGLYILQVRTGGIMETFKVVH